jgi:hypothetical protein
MKNAAKIVGVTILMVSIAAGILAAVIFMKAYGE